MTRWFNRGHRALIEATLEGLSLARNEDRKLLFVTNTGPITIR